MAQFTPAPFKCRFETASADWTLRVLQGEFCVFDFPGCRDCRFSLHSIKTVQAAEDPMKSLAWRNLGSLPMGDRGQSWKTSFTNRTWRCSKGSWPKRPT